ncbi:MAG: hypothetical protein R3D25_10130 [Geminicoccaceae bacterium]
MAEIVAAILEHDVVTRFGAALSGVELGLSPDRHHAQGFGQLVGTTRLALLEMPDLISATTSARVVLLLR